MRAYSCNEASVFARPIWQRLFDKGLVPSLPWAALTFICIVATGWSKVRPLYADSTAYRALAMGQYDAVLGSIAGRFLHPAVVRLVSHLPDLDVDDAFLVVAGCALAVFVANLAWILRQITGVGAVVLPLLFTPCLIHYMFGLYYCQDLFYAALLSSLFVMLMRGRTYLALALLLPLYLVRESTLLLALVWGIIAWFESDTIALITCGVLSIMGLALTRVFASWGQPNVHHTSELVFLLLKPPSDLLRTLFGVIVVPSEMVGRRGFTCSPFMTVLLPRVLHYGVTTEFGICRPELPTPLHTYFLGLSLFGIGPGLLWFLWSQRDRERAGWSAPVWLKIALTYGLLAFFIAPAVSFWLERDFGYSWPLFWIAMPFLIARFFPLSAPLTIVLLLENLAASWLTYWVGAESVRSALAALALALAAQVIAVWTIRTGLPESSSQSSTTSSHALASAAYDHLP